MKAQPPPRRSAFDSPDLSEPRTARAEVDDRTLNAGRAVLVALALLVVIAAVIVVL